MPNNCALASTRVKTITVSRADVWAWPMHETPFLAFQIEVTRILCLKPCVLDSRFLTEKLPFYPAVLLRRSSSSVKPVGSSEAELEAMECEQFSLSLPPSPRCHRGNSPVQFSRGCIAPNPEARDTVSFGLKDILYTAASDSEDFVAASLDVLPPSGQEARPSPAYTELVEVLAHACERLSLD